jgi:hypothetical protein
LGGDRDVGVVLDGGGAGGLLGGVLGAHPHRSAADRVEEHDAEHGQDHDQLHQPAGDDPALVARVRDAGVGSGGHTSLSVCDRACFSVMAL